MKHLKLPVKPAPQVKNRIAFRGGTYSIAITTVVLAIIITINIIVSSLPKTITKYDTSSSKLYSITSDTKVVVNALEKDVVINWIVQSGKEDEVIENLLGKYESLSEHITIVKKNPDIYPDYAEQYTSEEILNNSLVVECGERNRYISYNDIYVQKADMASYSYETSFDGEGTVTSAIDYVVNEEQPQLYITEGHGETELPSTFSNQIERENIEVSTFSLLKTGSVPEEADCVLIYAPQSDISAKEKNILADYVSDGGKLMVIAGPVQKGDLKNLYSLLSVYGVEANNGIVVEASKNHYAFQAPYVLLPEIAETGITKPLIKENYYVIMPISQGLTIKDTNTGNVKELLSSSDTSYSKIKGYNLKSYEKENDDIDGPFSLAVSIDCSNDGQIIWFSSSSFLDDKYNAYSSGANLDLGINALSSLTGESEAATIRSKPLNYNYLAISDSVSSMLKILMIGVLPLTYIGIGCGIILKRRKSNGTF